MRITADFAEWGVFIFRLRGAAAQHMFVNEDIQSVDNMYRYVTCVCTLYVYFMYIHIYTHIDIDVYNYCILYI